MSPYWWYRSIAFAGFSLCCGYIFGLHSGIIVSANVPTVSAEGSLRNAKMIDDNPVVQTMYGKIEGLSSKSRDGREYYEFLGIPYARPPVGNLRYMPPEDPSTWEGIKDATSYGEKCIQFDMLTDLIVGSENCLFLNVFTPKLPPKRNFFNWSFRKRLPPVLVYIHGGHFMYGGSDEYRPEYFMDEDIVVVTLNYRLNSFGFLNTEDDLVTGNMGLKDQNFALKWVKANIEQFGGDPTRILLAGQSAGGASVHYHLLSPMSNGLFQKAVSFSGSAVSPWAFSVQPREQANKLADTLGCPTNTTKDSVDCLRSLDAHKIVNVHKEILDILSDRLAFFTPTVEHSSSHDKPNRFLVDSPESLIASGRIASKVPWMTGVTSEEGLIFLMALFSYPDGVSRLNSQFNIYAPQLFDYGDVPETDRDRISQKIRAYYLHNKDIIEQFSLQNAEQLFTDANFNHGMRAGALEHSKHHPVYLYYYSNKGTFGFYQAFQAMIRTIPKVVDWVWSLSYRWFQYELAGKEEVHYGACHGDDTALLWKIPWLSHITKDSRDYWVSKAFIKSVVDFAKDSDSVSFDGVRWNPVSPEVRDKPVKLMRIATHPEIIDEPFYQSLSFWRREIVTDIKTSRSGQYANDISDNAIYY